MLRYRHNPYSREHSILWETPSTAPPPASPQPAMKKASGPPQKTPEPEEKVIHYLTSLCKHGSTCSWHQQGACLYAHHPGELMNYKDSPDGHTVNKEDARCAIYSLRRRADWNAWLAEEDKLPDRCVAYLGGVAVRCRDGKYRCREGCTLRHARFPHNLGEYL
ncbi:hypothetical protein AGDE_13382 [Angomonas deanei]|nr:hypothetical protein AGDE_13382 [Angomonas deanei]|eukprot:EPY22424.1 hypothetical protein AGDE_13382 [Angomonas deanei]